MYIDFSQFWEIVQVPYFSNETIFIGDFNFSILKKLIIWILWFGNVLYRQFGPRITLWLGGIFCSFGLALIAFWQSLLSFYIGIGFFVGLGFSFVILIGSVTISRYFKARFQKNFGSNSKQMVQMAKLNGPHWTWIGPIINNWYTWLSGLA